MTQHSYKTINYTEKCCTDCKTVKPDRQQVKHSPLHMLVQQRVNIKKLDNRNRMYKIMFRLCSQASSNTDRGNTHTHTQIHQLHSEIHRLSSTNLGLQLTLVDESWMNEIKATFYPISNKKKDDFNEKIDPLLSIYNHISLEHGSKCFPGVCCEVMYFIFTVSASFFKE